MGSETAAGPDLRCIRVSYRGLHSVYDLPEPSTAALFCRGGVFLLSCRGAGSKAVAGPSGRWKRDMEASGGGGRWWRWPPSRRPRMACGCWSTPAPSGVHVCERGGGAHPLHRCASERQEAAGLEQRRAYSGSQKDGLNAPKTAPRQKRGICAKFLILIGVPDGI